MDLNQWELMLLFANLLVLLAGVIVLLGLQARKDHRDFGPAGQSRRSNGHLARSTEVDFLRCIAIVAVVLIHSWNPAIERTAAKGLMQAAFFSTFVTSCLWALPVFFFVSGLVLSHWAGQRPWQGAGNWWKRRARRLLPPYFFWSAAYWFYGAMGANEARDFSDSLVWQLATGSAGHQMYFVVAIAQMYLLFPPILLLMRRSRRLRWYLGLGALVVSLFAFVLRAWDSAAGNPLDVSWGLMRSSLFPWVGYFALGCLIGLEHSEAGETKAHNVAPSLRPSVAALSARPRRWVIFVAGIVALVCLGVMARARIDYPGSGIYSHPAIALAPLYSICAILLLSAVSARWRIVPGTAHHYLVSTLACNAYGIFLAHELVRSALENTVFPSAWSPAFSTELLWRFSLLVLTLALSWMAVRLLALVPGLRWASGADLQAMQRTIRPPGF